MNDGEELYFTDAETMKKATRDYIDETGNEITPAEAEADVRRLLGAAGVWLNLFKPDAPLDSEAPTYEEAVVGFIGRFSGDVFADPFWNGFLEWYYEKYPRIRCTVCGTEFFGDGDGVVNVKCPVCG